MLIEIKKYLQFLILNINHIIFKINQLNKELAGNDGESFTEILLQAITIIPISIRREIYPFN